ncbi:MFS general substrate transporter [Cryphonectria parasitica EP155]|uniref:MFS general substrate transporter n=1 Tax=Cryphonectria parasitica (strain ATCC 38755 / EP155) TaxID=660469 RepID=A0A9P4YCG8_CRYP1|nr:MFS general substrate transporter [Cryphonectria parasitica EP155]KAF3770821.1 MFS general substrate transporter [Cryphonectria parasitica EP155]
MERHEAGPEDGTQEEQTVLATDVSGARLWVILSSAYVGVFLGAIDTTIIATLSAPISSEFKSLSLLSWLAAAYLIANAACQPISGRLTDIFGRGPGLVFSNVFFAAGNLICGLAQSDTVIIVGRVVAGIGGGGLMAISTFLASDLVPLRKRGVIQGIGNICFGSGAMLGGVFGGFVNDTSSWGWRLAFLVQVPVVVVSGLLVFFLVRVPPKMSNKSALSRIDFVGALLIMSFLVVLLLGLNAGGNLVPWTDPLVLTTLPLALALLIAFIAWESRSAQPIIPVRLLIHRTVFTACMTNLVCTMANTILIFYVPIYLQVLGYSPTQSGFRILFGSLGVSVSSLGCGVIMKKTGRYLGLGICVVLSFVAGAALITTLDENSPSWVPFPAFVLTGGGYGGMLTVTLLACIAAVDHAQQAVITSATYAFRSVGATLGVTVASVVYQNILKARLWDRFGSLPGAAEEIKRIRDDLDELRRLPAGWGEGVIASFMEAFRGVWLTTLGLGIAGLICVSLMKQHKLHSNLARSED